jgi:hypothetical protein
MKRRFFEPRMVALVLACGATSGCVTMYQPLTSLQRPVAVDPTIQNFAGTRMLVRCTPSEYLDDYDSQVLCRTVGRLFQNQGATVDTEVPVAGRAARERDEDQRPDLIVELSSRLLNQQESVVLWILCISTSTLVPAVSEFSFAQDIRVRDASGTVLVADSLQARFTRYTGIAVWGVNWVLDLIVRPEGERLTGDIPNREFSKDLYGQITQLVLNAQMRSTVLRGFEQRATPTPPPDGVN